jgi:hypothetical protein
LILAEFSVSGFTPSTQPVQRSAAYRFLLAAVILLGVLIVIALGVLVVGLSIRLGGHRQPDSASVEYPLVPGTQVLSTDVSGDRLVVRLHGPRGDEVDVIDLRNGHLVAKFRRAEPQQ